MTKRAQGGTPTDARPIYPAGSPTQPNGRTFDRSAPLLCFTNSNLHRAGYMISVLQLLL